MSAHINHIIYMTICFPPQSNSDWTRSIITWVKIFYPGICFISWENFSNLLNITHCELNQKFHCHSPILSHPNNEIKILFWFSIPSELECQKLFYSVIQTLWTYQTPNESWKLEWLEHKPWLNKFQSNKNEASIG